MTSTMALPFQRMATSASAWSNTTSDLLQLQALDSIDNENLDEQNRNTTNNSLMELSAQNGWPSVFPSPFDSSPSRTKTSSQSQLQQLLNQFQQIPTDHFQFNSLPEPPSQSSRLLMAPNQTTPYPSLTNDPPPMDQALVPFFSSDFNLVVPAFRNPFDHSSPVPQRYGGEVEQPSESYSSKQLNHSSRATTAPQITDVTEEQHQQLRLEQTQKLLLVMQAEEEKEQQEHIASEDGGAPVAPQPLQPIHIRPSSTAFPYYPLPSLPQPFSFSLASWDTRELHQQCGGELARLAPRDIFRRMISTILTREECAEDLIIEEAVLVPEVLAMLQGVGTQHFLWNQEDRVFYVSPSQLRLTDTTPNALTRLLVPFLQLGSTIRSLNEFVAVHTVTGVGVVVHAFARAVGHVLQQYMLTIIRLEGAILKRRSKEADAVNRASLKIPITLMEISLHLQPVMEKMAFLAELTQLPLSLNAPDTFLRGADLLSYLYTLCLSQTGLTLTRSSNALLLRTIFLRCFQAYMTLVYEWVYRGAVADTWHEFIVEWRERRETRLPGAHSPSSSHPQSLLQPNQYTVDEKSDDDVANNGLDAAASSLPSHLVLIPRRRSSVTLPIFLAHLTDAFFHAGETVFLLRQFQPRILHKDETRLAARAKADLAAAATRSRHQHRASLEADEEAAQQQKLKRHQQQLSYAQELQVQVAEKDAALAAMRLEQTRLSEAGEAETKMKAEIIEQEKAKLLAELESVRSPHSIAGGLNAAIDWRAAREQLSPVRARKLIEIEYEYVKLLEQKIARVDEELAKTEDGEQKAENEEQPTETLDTTATRKLEMLSAEDTHTANEPDESNNEFKQEKLPSSADEAKADIDHNEIQLQPLPDQTVAAGETTAQANDHFSEAPTSSTAPVIEASEEVPSAASEPVVTNPSTALTVFTPSDATSLVPIEAGTLQPSLPAVILEDGDVTPPLPPPPEVVLDDPILSPKPFRSLPILEASVPLPTDEEDEDGNTFSSSLATQAMKELSSTFQSDTSPPLPILLQSTIFPALLTHIHHVSNLGLAHFRLVHASHTHLAMLRQYLLMQSGMLMNDFCEAWWKKARESVARFGQVYIDPLGLKMLLQQASQTCQLNQDHHAIAMRHLQFTIQKDTDFSLTDLTCFRGISLNYLVPYPLSLIFSPASLVLYTRVWQFLMQLNRVQDELQLMWKKMKQQEAVSASSAAPVTSLIRGRLRVLECVRSEMSHFVTILRGYIMTEVIEAGWQRLQTRLNKVHSWMEWSGAHERYIQEIHQACFRHTEPRAKTQGNDATSSSSSATAVATSQVISVLSSSIEKILCSIIDFTTRVTLFEFTAVAPASASSPTISAWYSILSSRDRFRNYVQFLVQIMKHHQQQFKQQQYASGLSSNASSHQPIAIHMISVNELLNRLDFNRFYQEKELEVSQSHSKSAHPSRSSASASR